MDENPLSEFRNQCNEGNLSPLLGVLPGGSLGGGGPGLVLFVADRRPVEDRDLVLDGVDDVSDDGEDDKEEDDYDGDDDVAFYHF